jgi:hypothetical protein
MEKEEKTNLLDYIKKWISKIRDWLQPEPTDNALVQILKLALKCIALLILIALSPAILVIMLFVFFAAI